jgi:16S rRNA (guanine527-N7)-methyltransferase
LFEEQLAFWGVDLSQEQVQDLRRFASMLSSYTEANVIGTRSLQRIMEDHILDSLSCLLFRGFDDCSKLIDVGSGAGLPGIPLKLARPDIELALLESTAKKARFISESVAELGISGVEVVNARAEEAGRWAGHRATYDTATARALASLAVVAEYCVPFVRVGGRVVAMKGRISAAELGAGERAAAVLGARVSEVLPVPLLPQVRAQDRCLVVLEKVDETPRRYPRRTGAPRKQPLGGHARRN